MSNYTVRVVIEDPSNQKTTNTSVQKPRQKSKSRPKTMVTTPSTAQLASVALATYLLSVDKVISTAETINGYVGEWTEKRVRQRQTALKLRRTKQLLTLDAIGYAKSETNDWIQWTLSKRRDNIKSSYNQFVSGNTKNTGSRYDGGRRR